MLVKITIFLSLLWTMDASAALIVKFKNNQSISSKQISQFNMLFNFKDSLIEDMGVYLVEPKVSTMTTATAVQTIANMPYVEYVQEDHVITLREKKPNDEQFEKQWHLSKIAAPAAWNANTGGKNSLGQEPVLAVVDQGMDITHQDLKENIWVNSNEIPGNNIDDDENGYIDDVNGWNAVANNGNVKNSSLSESHSTHVAGIAGAKGNNGIQVSGVNWDLKIMAIKILGNSSSSLTSLALKSYGYVIKQKKLWIETKGQRGANIVVTNSSFGVDYANCNTGEYPAWNDIYNEMGKVGILSAAATANLNIDVDVKGDVPTGCSSPYIIAVTNTSSTDDKFSGAAYGKTTVDLGAPGTAIVSTTPNNMTAAMTGTSMATPVIAGSVAFLHAVASMDLINLITEDPAKGALAIKDILLNTVDKLPALEGKSVTGGRVNLDNASKSAQGFTLSSKTGYNTALMYFMNQ